MRGLFAVAYFHAYLRAAVLGALFAFRRRGIPMLSS